MHDDEPALAAPAPVSNAPVAAVQPGNDAWRERDLRVLWHPCTQMREHPERLPLVPIRRGRGVWLEDFDGRRYLDAVSSWWTNLFGHAEPRIGAAIAAQAQQLEQVMLAGFGHEPAIALAEELLRIGAREGGLTMDGRVRAQAGSRSQPPVACVCYGDNGAAAVEVALRMS